MSLLQRISVTSYFAAAGPLSSLKITVYEQVNFFWSWVGVSMEKRKKTRQHFCSGWGSSEKKVYATSSFRELTVYLHIIPESLQLVLLYVDWSMISTERLLLEDTMVQGKKIHPGEISLFFGKGRGENLFCVYRNWLSLHDAANGWSCQLNMTYCYNWNKLLWYFGNSWWCPVMSSKNLIS